MFPTFKSYGFDLATCRALAKAAKAAYLRPAEIQTEVYLAGARSFDFISSAETSTECFCASREHDCVISFRGTENIKDWITDAQFRRTTWNELRVHRGFAAAIDSVIKDIAEYVMGCGATRIWITGHSLGGALAILCAWELRLYGITVTGVYTFGSPRVGDAAFADLYDSFFKDRTFRIVNRQDIITRVPGVFAGYRHCGTEIFFDAFGKIIVDPRWYSKIPSDFTGLAAEFNPIFPLSSVAAEPLRNHFMVAYNERLNS